MKLIPLFIHPLASPTSPNMALVNLPDGSMLMRIFSESERSSKFTSKFQVKTHMKVSVITR